jgi:hypothetical protein
MDAGLKALLNRALNFDGSRTRAGSITRLPTQSKAGSSQSKTGGAAKSDSLTLSDPLKSLKDSGIDLDGSTFIDQAQMVSFNLQFKDEQVRSLTSNGYYDLRSQSLQVDFSFSSALTVMDAETGQERQELFQFDFHLEASHVQAAWGEQRVEKEDILHFARKIVGKISKLYAEGKEIDGLDLDSEDLRELGAVDDGKLLKSIMQIIEIMRNVDFLRGKNGDHVWVKPERGKTLVTEEGQQEERSSKMSLSVRRLSVEAEQTSTIETPVAEESPIESTPEEQPN